MEKLEVNDERSRWEMLEDLDAWLHTPMLVLSFAWLALVLYELAVASSALLETLGTAIWIVFLAEFCVRLALAPQKGVFLKRNWLTILALAAPAFRLFSAFRVLRAARALRGFRLMRIVGTANRSMIALKSTLSRRRFGYVAALTLLIIALGAAGMRSFEGRMKFPADSRPIGMRCGGPRCSSRRSGRNFGRKPLRVES